MKPLSFTKLSATGNDFILIDNRSIGLSEKDVDFFRRLCRRRSAVGADGILLIDESAESDFALRYFNADGSESECGNGARAAAFYSAQSGITGDVSTFEFGENIYEACVQKNSVKLRFPPVHQLQEGLGVATTGQFDEAGFVNTGVPHFVLFYDNLKSLDVGYWGKEYRHHTFFQPAGTNVDFVRATGEQEIEIRTFERGIEGETLACGTGAVASAIFANRKKQVAFPVRVRTQGGDLIVHFDGAKEYRLEGEVVFVYEATLNFP